MSADPRGTSTLQDFALGPYIPHTNQSFPLLRHILDQHPPGNAIEFGVGAGTSLAIIAQHMPATGFDSFKGLPADWRPGYPKGSLAFHPPTIPNTHIITGWFADTLPTFNFTAIEPISLVHIDCDLGDSTATALTYIGPHLETGCYIIFDEFFGYDGCQEHEQRAWFNYAQQTEAKWDVIGHGEQEWAIRLT